jgi:hypothetical protein
LVERPNRHSSVRPKVSGVGGRMISRRFGSKIERKSEDTFLHESRIPCCRFDDGLERQRALDRELVRVWLDISQTSSLNSARDLDESQYS